MTSFLINKHDQKSYEEKISTSPSSTQRNKKYAIKLFDGFVSEKHGRTSNEVIEELHQLREKENQETYEQSLYGMLQEWINWNQKNGIGNYSIRTSFSNLRKYLFHMGIKTSEQEIKEFLIFGRPTKEERYPLSNEQYRKIIEGFSRNPRFQALFLALGSSGMRIGEALGLKKKDLDLTEKRIKVNIPATTKTRAGRTSYLSFETEKVLRPILDKIDAEDYIFAKKNSKPIDQVVRKALNRLLDKIEFTEKYQSNQYKKITSHSFRAYFFTKAARKHGDNYAHRMTGHGGYLMQYDRMTEEEKLKMYLELESDLVVFDQTKNELEIQRLQREVGQVEQLKQEIQELRKNQAEQDKRILEQLAEKGIVPKIL